MLAAGRGMGPLDVERRFQGPAGVGCRRAQIFTVNDGGAARPYWLSKMARSELMLGSL